MSLKMEKLTLGRMIDHLSKIPDLDNKYVYFDFCNVAPAQLASYRGHYNELAMGWKEEGETLASDLLAMLRHAVGKKFTGWKGGEYLMMPDTPLWIANPGRTGDTYPCMVIDHGHCVYIITENEMTQI